MDVTWTLQDANNRYSAVVDAAARATPQKVTRRGKWVSVVSIGEIERGLARKRTSDAGFALQLAGWLDQLLRLYGDRLLPVDVGVHVVGAC